MDKKINDLKINWVFNFSFEKSFLSENFKLRFKPTLSPIYSDALNNSKLKKIKKQNPKRVAGKVCESHQVSESPLVTSDKNTILHCI